MSDKKISKKQNACVTRYVKKHYDRVSVTMPKGRKDEIKAAADKSGESVNQYINSAINQRMSQDGS